LRRPPGTQAARARRDVVGHARDVEASGVRTREPVPSAFPGPERSNASRRLRAADRQTCLGRRMCTRSASACRWDSPS